MSGDFDLVIRDATIIDGGGGDPYEGDVAVTGGRIAATGKVAGRGREEISAKGLLVTPGFVDIHTHYDGQVTWSERLDSSSLHGVTTVLMGNCGVGFAPCRPADRDTLVAVMEGVEDIPEIVMRDGLPWAWESFADYLDFLDTRRCDIDFAAQIGHSPIRVFVMGERGAAREPATAEDMARMTEIVRDAVTAGAMGVSTSQNINHRTAAGELAPTVGTPEDEMYALARGLALAGRGVFQMVPNAHNGEDPAEEMRILRRIAEIGKSPVSFTVLEKNTAPEAAQMMLRLIEQAVADGLAIKGQVYPRPIGMLFGLALSFHPLRYKPSFRPLEKLPLAQQVAALRDPALKARLLAEKTEHTNPNIIEYANRCAELYELGDPPNYEPDPEERIGARAARMGVSAESLTYDLMLKRDGQAIMMNPNSNYIAGSLDPVRRMLTHKDTLIALGDGGAHYGLLCDSSFTTTLLGHWTRDRSHDRLPLPWAVKSITRDTALAVGFRDRGLVAPGFKADINIIDYANLRACAPYVVHDLPAGGRRVFQKAEGYRATIVSGVVTYRDGVATGALPGRLVRSKQRQ